ncbi:MAG: cysteine rich repeat-containing protein [Pseudomonadota bacterium]
MRHALSILATAACLALPAPVYAQSLFSACESDIATYCDTVEPGNGRIMACLYSREDKLSESCDAAAAEPLDILDLFFARLRDVVDDCREDLASLCADSAAGDGRILACLRSQESALGETCRGAISTIRLPEDG